MIFDINQLLDKILVELKIFNPIYCRQYEDPRIDTYYIAINHHNYIILYGDCDAIIMYNNKNINYNLMTKEGLTNFVNNNDEINDMSDIVFEIKLEKFNNINDIILLIGIMYYKIYLNK